MDIPRLDCPYSAGRDDGKKGFLIGIHSRDPNDGVFHNMECSNTKQMRFSHSYCVVENLSCEDADKRG